MLQSLLGTPSLRCFLIILFMLSSASTLGARQNSPPKVAIISSTTGISVKTADVPPVTAATSPSTGPFVFAYDAAGRLVGVADAVGNTATYTYDAAGNVLSIARGSSAVAFLAFRPSSGSVGANVTILGAGFGATSGQNAVTFNGVPAAVVTASSNQLVVVVPGGATTGLIRVTSPAGSATSASAFTVVPNNVPSISGFAPMIGIAGSTVRITGANFEPVAGSNIVSFNGTVGSVSSATASMLGAIVPSPATSGYITVSTSHGRATSTIDFFVPPWQYIPADVGPTGRMAIGETRTVTISPPKKIGLIVFSGSAGQRIFLGNFLNLAGGGCGDVSILRPDGSFLVDLPGLCGVEFFIDPQVLPVSGTYLIVLNPAGQTGTITLTLYNVPPDVTASIMPGGSPVTATTTAPGQRAIVTFAGSAGQRVSLKALFGTGMTDSCNGISILKPDGTVLNQAVGCDPLYFSDVLALPATGVYTIVVNPGSFDFGSTSLTLYNVPPDVTANIVVGGSPVTVTTTTPGQRAILTFSGSAGQPVSLDVSFGVGMTDYACNQISIQNPDGTSLPMPVWACDSLYSSGALVLPATGVYTIKVSPGSVNVGSATLTLYTPLAVASISPRGGSTLGGTPVVLSGAKFQAGATVSIGGVAATSVVVASSTRITAVTGAHAAGLATITVTNPDNSSESLYYGYFYNPPSGALAFFTIPPCRVVDTRNANDPWGGPALAAGAVRAFLLTGQCGIPVAAKAVSANVTVTGPAAGGYLSLYPGNALPLGTSNISFSAGQTRACNSVLELASDGSGSVVVLNGAGGTVQFILDVNGYFQ
jgi:YD repeat-containing protein